jgi:hypothetical protein
VNAELSSGTGSWASADAAASASEITGP